MPLFSEGFESETCCSAMWREEILCTLGAAEAAFGRRDNSFTIRCVAKGRTGKNRIEMGRGGDSGIASDQVIIRLEKRCWRDGEYRTAVLAHEVVHLLNPTLVCNVTYLEEGVAEHFALMHFRSRYGRNWAEKNAEPLYRTALEDVQRLTKIDPLAIVRIRGKTGWSLSEVKASDLLLACPTCPSQLARRLTRRFYPPGYDG